MATRRASTARGGLTLVSIGDFGAHVARLLARRPGTVSRAAPTLPNAVESLESAFETGAGAVVIAMSRPCPALCEKADDLSLRHRLAWLPVFMNYPHVQVGPLVVPGRAGCFGCFLARLAQHDRQPSATAAQHAAYDHDESQGPQGYLDHDARLAAALAELVLDEPCASSAPPAAEVIRFSILHSDVRRDRLVPRAGCPRCGGLIHPPKSRVAEVIRSLAAQRVRHSSLAKTGRSGGRANGR